MQATGGERSEAGSEQCGRGADGQGDGQPKAVMTDAVMAQAMMAEAVIRRR